MTHQSQSPAANGARQDSTKSENPACTQIAAKAQDISASNSLADRVAHPTTQADLLLAVLVACRSAGASVRAMAKLVGVSKSTMGRWLPAIDALASQMEQREGNSPAVSSADLSQMGRAAEVRS
jgi:hypothetical protein